MEIKLKCHNSYIKNINLKKNEFNIRIIDNRLSDMVVELWHENKLLYSFLTTSESKLREIL
ncbi:MAG: hypothetical protein ACFFDY_01200 [Candidatus Thorarchaeota archaeon]